VPSRVFFCFFRGHCQEESKKLANPEFCVFFRFPWIFKVLEAAGTKRVWPFPAQDIAKLPNI